MWNHCGWGNITVIHYVNKGHVCTGTAVSKGIQCTTVNMVIFLSTVIEPWSSRDRKSPFMELVFATVNSICKRKIMKISSSQKERHLQYTCASVMLSFLHVARTIHLQSTKHRYSLIHFFFAFEVLGLIFSKVLALEVVLFVVEPKSNFSCTVDGKVKRKFTASW